MFMISGVWDVSLAPKTNYVYLWRPQDAFKIQDKTQIVFDVLNFKQINQQMQCLGGKGQAPKQTDELLNNTLKILDTRSIYFRTHDMTFW